MKNRTFGDFCKNAVGTVFLLAAAFFVCSTLVSMRAVLADPIAPMNITAAAPQSARAGTSRASGRTSPRTTAASTARTTTAASRSVASRATTSRAAVSGMSASRGTTVAPSRATATSRGMASTTASRANTATSRGVSASPRNVASRTTTSRGTTATASASRGVAARTATSANTARVSLQGSAIRGTKATSGSTYTYLSNKLYTGNYSNIIDPTTGLISADAYNNCMESYYACMDEICTARNTAQRRCACAGRVKAFADAELQLESANEELIKVSGELALLIATKGKDVSSAFQLTDAEKVMNCVSWRETSKNGTVDEKTFGDWCADHGIYDNTQCNNKVAPDYCSSTGNSFGFDVNNLAGSGSDILAQLQSWADAKDKTLTITASNDSGLTAAFENLAGVVSNLSGLNNALSNSEDLKDSLAETWGYELFEYAHNNVCNRVLDSCFNGIYEACGTPNNGNKCSNGAASCPYNYNSKITVNNTGSYELNFVTGSNTSSTTSATCFGYTSTSGDPYSNLRGPVADARRSILQKYALDANADCDAYGEQLRTTAQNIGYQKVAAQQALQQKRLEFAQEEEAAILADISSAKQNYLSCLDDIQQCRYDVQRQYANQGWTTNRIRSYCNTKTQVPSCYEVMVCDQNATRVITADDVKNDTNLVQNVVTLTDILSLGTDTPRGVCLGNDMNVGEIRNFGSESETRDRCIPQNGTDGYKDWDATNQRWGECQATACNTGYRVTAVGNNKVCQLPANAEYSADATTVGPFVPMVGAQCKNGYVASNGNCVSAQCPTSAEYSTKCLAAAVDGTVGGCAKLGCKCINATKASGGLCLDGTEEPEPQPETPDQGGDSGLDGE